MRLQSTAQPSIQDYLDPPPVSITFIPDGFQADCVRGSARVCVLLMCLRFRVTDVAIRVIFVRDIYFIILYFIRYIFIMSIYICVR